GGGCGGGGGGAGSPASGGARKKTPPPPSRKPGVPPPLLARGELPSVDPGSVGRSLVADHEGVPVPAEQEVPVGGVAVIEGNLEHAAVPPGLAWSSPEDADHLAAVEPVPGRRLSQVVGAEDLHQGGRKLGRLRSATGGAPCPPGLLSLFASSHGTGAYRAT